MSNIAFVPLKEEHLTLLHQWFQIIHVKKWYARNISYTLKMIEDKYLPRIKDKQNIRNYIVILDNQPIGYIQMYNLEYSLPDGINSYDHPLFEKYSPKNIVGIDLFIAQEKYLRKGIGSRLINEFINAKLTDGYGLIVVDPHSTNTIAVQFFLKNGFKEFKNEDIDSDYKLLIKILGMNE